MHGKHLWVLDLFLLSDPDSGWSEEVSDRDALNACLKNWGSIPSMKGISLQNDRAQVTCLRQRRIGEDVRETRQPELV